MKKGDYFLIGFILLFSITCIVLMSFSRTKGGIAVVYSDNKEVGRYPLSDDTSLTIKYNDQFNTICIDNGSVYVSEASCPDEYCVHQLHISRVGESIVCLPNRLVIKIENGKGDEYDAITQ